MKKLYFDGPNPTVDLVILNHEGRILLIKRKGAILYLTKKLSRRCLASVY